MSGKIYLQKYRAERFLGEGGMSLVYLGRQLDLDREVAIKVLRSELSTHAKAIAHFRREIHITSRLDHPNAVTFYDADAEAAHPVLVTEYCRGHDLSEILKKQPRLPLLRVGRLLSQLCAVLHDAHEAGVVHQDLKPANVMIVHPNSPAEKVKLMDFGLAKMSALFFIDRQELAHPPNPVTCGTPEYLSPEQARGNDVDRRSDVYALGVLLYELLTGRRPFERKCVDDMLLAHIRDVPPTFAKLGLSVRIPEEIDVLVQDCLAKYPEERPANAEEVARRFGDALGTKFYSESGKSTIAKHRSTGGLSRATIERLSDLDNIHDRNAITCQVNATMPESMALLKLKGFIHDLGGQVIASTPGYVRVQLAFGEDSRSVFGWFKGKKRACSVIDLELRVQPGSPTSPNDLCISMFLRSSEGRFNEEDRRRCARLSRDLQAYLR